MRKDSSATNSFDVTQCTLVSYVSNATVDITKLWDSIEIYEDMYTNCLSGQIEILDSLNLLYHFSICGREKLILSFSVPVLDGGSGKSSITRTFRIYKISERQPQPNDMGLRYTLHFVSEEFVKSQQTKISKAFEGTVDQMVKTIYEDYLKVDYGNSLNQKPLQVDKTLHKHRFVIPYWSPLSAINWLAARGVSLENRENCNFVFYEDLQGFQFKSFSNLAIATAEPVAQFEYFSVVRNAEGGQPSVRNLQREYETIQDFLMMEYHNTMKNIENGFFSSRLLTHDIVRKKWAFSDYSYGRDFFSGQDHVHERPLVAPGNDDLSDKNWSYFKYYPKHTGLMGSESSMQDNDRYSDWVLKRNAQMQQIEGCQLQISVPGDSTLRIGSVVNIVIPSFEAKDNGYVDWLDKYMSGKYIVSAIRHRLVSASGYTMRIELTRDSLPSALPDSKILNIRDWPSQGDYFTQVVKA